MSMISVLIAAALVETTQCGIGLKVESESETRVIDPARSVFLRVEVKTPPDRTATMPDLRSRCVGFSLAEDIPLETRKEGDGSTVQAARWRLVPEPCADVYKIKPFVVKGSPKIYRAQSDEGKFSFYAGPINFERPTAREPVTGDFELDLRPDLWSRLDWKFAGWGALALAAGALLVFGLWRLAKYAMRRVREHMMSPIERAWAELDRLLKEGLPGRGRYKDFYVELTMIVRRYVQRQHGVVAPHLTTEEFFAVARNAESFPKDALDELMEFLRNADMVKFAGVQATPEMTDAATDSARTYIEKDDRSAGQRTKTMKKGGRR